MCRLLTVRDQNRFEIDPWLSDFANACRDSPEYQGHGWGMAWKQAGEWQVHKSLTPIWEDELAGFGSCQLLMVHARSAFRDEGIVIENNMPFYDQTRYFIFNGELQGVRIKAEGRIGAEKIFNHIKRFDKGNLEDAFRRGVAVIRHRTQYVRGMNIILSEGERLYVTTHYGENPDYFTLYRQDGVRQAFCSVPLGSGWKPMANHTTAVV